MHPCTMYYAYVASYILAICAMHQCATSKYMNEAWIFKLIFKLMHAH